MIRARTALLGAVMVLTSLPLEARPTSAANQLGSLVIIGGVLRYDNELVWQRIMALAGGDLADIVVFPTANNRPKLHGGFSVRGFQRYGGFVELMPISVTTTDFDLSYQKATTDQILIDKIRGASGVFFVGGAPQRIATVLYGDDGSSSAVVDAIRDVYRSGGVIAGIDAGSAVLDTGIDAWSALRAGRVKTNQIHPGIGLIRDWLVDQHFLSHGRFAESLVAMRQLGFRYALGVGVNTAVVITNGGEAEVMGDNGAVVVDLSRANSDQSVSAFNLKGARLSYLGNGDRFDLRTLTATPHARKEEGFKVDPHAADHQSFSDEPVFVSDVLANGMLRRLMIAALDDVHHEAVGLAMADGAELGDLAFKFRLYVGRDSMGWLETSSGSERYTVLNVCLDVMPTTKRSQALHLRPDL
ncbi:MAG: cyanophycinase [Gammaproteobacteria bacterium]